MRKGFIASALAIIIAGAFWMSVPAGCANIVPPEGGPRDTLSPVLISATPRDSSVNFRSQHIVLTFNEDIDDPRNANDIIYTPSMDMPPTITTKGKAMTVKFNDSLEPNTTYVINFGDQIIDITEGNPVRNFVYTFSTGSYLDSLEISGKVILAENGGVDTTLNVVLYKDRSDSAVRLKNPLYVVRLDRNGNFSFHNLPKDTFAIYAFGGGRRYNSRELFAFYDTSVVAGEADSVRLYAFREPPTTSTASNTGTARIPANDRRLRFTPSTTTQQELLNDYTLTFPVPLRSFDSTKIHLATDSVYNPVNFTATLDTTRKEVRIKTAWKESTPYHLILEKEFAADTTGRQLLKTDTLSFTTKSKADYGTITALRFRNLDKYKHPVLQFVLNNQVVKSVPLTGIVYSETLVTPGEYSLRIFDDVNQNGKWDTGRFFGGKRQPEIIHPIERPFTIKPNWDNEFEVVL